MSGGIAALLHSRRGTARFRWQDRRDRRFLRTDPADVGCGQAMEILHVYVDLVAADPDAARRYPGVAAHLAERDPCCEDFRGPLAAVTEDR